MNKRETRIVIDYMHYLKPNIKAEPIIWRWYAWPHLISPTTAAGNIVHRHLKIMQSYVQNPEIHIESAKNPKLIGGPFVDLEGIQTEKMTDLIEYTQEKCSNLIALNTAIKEFDKVLHSEAEGGSLEQLYAKIPVPLKGLIELIYDLNNHPSIRFIEPLIYKKYYQTSEQSIALSEVKTDFRKFVLSTPRVNHSDEIYIHLPFSSEKLDHLFRMKTIPGNINDAADQLQIPTDKHSLFQDFFTKSAPKFPKDRDFNANGVRIRYLGHACILIQTQEVSILFDPVVSYQNQNSNIPRYTFEDLPDFIDYIVISHNHQDHILFETLLQLRHKIGTVLVPCNRKGALQDPSLRLILEHIGFKNVYELDEFQSIKLKDGEILGVPFLGEHADLGIHSKLSYFIHLKGKKFILAADSNNLDPVMYDHIHDITGDIDFLFLGMECDGAPLSWLYGPLLTTPIKRSHDQSRQLSGSHFEHAWNIVTSLKAGKVFIYAMGQEPWLGYIMGLQYTEDSFQIVESNKLLEACRAHGIESKRLFGKEEWVISP